MADPLSTDELHERLERRVLGPEGQGRRAYLFREVNIATRRADAVSVGLWASRGIKVEGFELKTNRRDWMSEMEDHEKAEPAMEICDHFWLVTNPDVLLPGELPDKWGLLVSQGRNRHLKVEKPAPTLRDRLEEPVPRSVLPSLLRLAYDLRGDELADIREEAREQGRRSAEREQTSMEHRLEALEATNARFKEGWETFRALTGLDFYEWLHADPEKMKLVGELAAALLEGPKGIERIANRIRQMETNAAELVAKLNEALGTANDAVFGEGA